MSCVRVLYGLLLAVHISSGQQGKPSWGPNITKTHMIDWLLKNTVCDSEVDYSSFDGWHHNLAKADVGSRGGRILGEGEGIEITTKSHLFMKYFTKFQEKRIKSSCRFNGTEYNQLLFFLGKEITKEIFGPTSFQKFNLATPYIDGEVIYGSSRHATVKYAATSKGAVDISTSSFSNLDEPSAALKHMWLAWHNAIAKKLHDKCHKWSSIKVFNEARKFTIATQQHIYYNVWLKEWTNVSLEPYERYNPGVDPQVQSLFLRAAYLPQSKETNNSHKNPIDLFAETLLQRPCELIELLKEKTFTGEFRVLGLNHARRMMNLLPYSNAVTFLKENDCDEKNFQDMTQIDSWLGGSMEILRKKTSLFVNVILDQFRRIRNGDRFWFENKVNLLFKNDEDLKIKLMKIEDIYLTVSNKFDPNLLNNMFKIQNKTGHQRRKDNKKITSNDNWLKNPIVLAALIILIYICALILRLVYLIYDNEKCLQCRDITETENILKKFESNEPNTNLLFIVQDYEESLINRMILVLSKETKQIDLYSTGMKRVHLFKLEFKTYKVIKVSDRPLVVLKSTSSYDTVLQFETKTSRFLAEISSCTIPLSYEKWTEIENHIFTKCQYKMLAEQLFRVVFAQVFKIDYEDDGEINRVDIEVAQKVLSPELSLAQFADCFDMTPHEKFIKTIFHLIDRQNRGCISLRSFLDLFITFTNYNEENKGKQFFKTYDINVIHEKESMTREAFEDMLRSFLVVIGENSSIDFLLRKCNGRFKIHDFEMLVEPYLHKLSSVKLQFDKSIKYYEDTKSHVNSNSESIINNSCIEPVKALTCNQSLITYFQNRSKQFFWMVCLNFAIIVVFAQKMGWSTEGFSSIDTVLKNGSRAITYPVLITFIALFITSRQHLAVYLENTIFNQYVPFKCFPQMHRYFAKIFGIFIVLHTAGELYFCWPHFNAEKQIDSVTITGLLLIVPIITSYVLFLLTLRPSMYNESQYSTNLYPVVLFVMIFHGLVSKPMPDIFFVLPVLLLTWTLNLLLAITNKEIRNPIKLTENLPSNVTFLTLKRPFNFNVGQWVRLSIDKGLNRFMVSSQSSEHDISIFVPPYHVSAQDIKYLTEIPEPEKTIIFMKGPYGKSMAHWRLYETIVFIAHGSGVARFSSVLADIAVVLSTNTRIKKIYFLWTTKSQKHFEWVVKLLREVELKDRMRVFECHIFINELYKNFDLRTTMMFICEQYYSKVCDRNIFTGIRASIHFGQLDYGIFFKKFLEKHKETVGVFTSGPSSLKREIESICKEINLTAKIHNPLMHEHFEEFTD